MTMLSHIISSTPRSTHANWQRVGNEGSLFVTNGSRIFNIGLEIIEQLDLAAEIGDVAVGQLLSDLGLQVEDFVDDVPIKFPSLQAISLAVAQKCNLGCTYCYADQGNFGGPAKNMSFETARQSVDLLMEEASPGSNVNIAFLGGEPLANRNVLRKTTEYAVDLARRRNLHPTFSITTNGTLLSEDDGIFFEQFGFAVTVSLDGVGIVHDQQRPQKNGSGSFNRIISLISPILRMQKKMQVSVRTTVTPQNLNLVETLDYFLNLGFHSVGFSPLLRSPTGTGEMQPHHLTEMLSAMMECGLEFERRLMKNERYAFSN